MAGYESLKTTDRSGGQWSGGPAAAWLGVPLVTAIAVAGVRPVWSMWPLTGTAAIVTSSAWAAIAALLAAERGTRGMAWFFFLVGLGWAGEWLDNLNRGRPFSATTKRRSSCARHVLSDHTGCDEQFLVGGERVEVDLAAAVVPYVTAVAGAYGAAVVAQIRDSAADGTADAATKLGRRLLARILRRPDESATRRVIDAVQEIAEHPTDPDAIAALRLQLRRAFTDDPQLAVEITGMLPDGSATVQANGQGAVAVEHNAGIIQTGRNSQATQGLVRDDRRSR